MSSSKFVAMPLGSTRPAVLTEPGPGRVIRCTSSVKYRAYTLLTLWAGITGLPLLSSTGLLWVHVTTKSPLLSVATLCAVAVTFCVPKV